jgi:phosphatidyl-myo-inositol dimannoside synthase
VHLVVLASELPPGPGGIANHAHQLSLEMVRRGWEVTALGPQDYVDTAEATRWRRDQPFECEPLRHLPGAPLQGAVWAWRLAAVLRRRRADRLLASGQRVVWLAAAVAPFFRLPWIAVAHGSELVNRPRWEGFLTRRSFARAAAVVAVSDYTRGLLREAGIEPRRCEVIPNGADARTFAGDPPGWPSELLGDDRLHPGRRLLVTVGRVGERKGQDLVVRALPRIVTAMGDVHYVAVGLPERADELRRLANGLGVGERLHLPGRLPTDAVRALLHRADLFVMPSRRTSGGDVEGYGIAVVEAALCGLPAVVGRGSGLVEAIEVGETGLAVDPEDPAELARAVEALLGDDDRRREVGRRARRRALAEQTWERRAADYERLLVDLDSPA